MTDQLAWLTFCVALIFVLEGFLPAVSPKVWKNLLEKISTIDDSKTRIMGVLSMLFGAVIMAVLHNIYKV